MQDILLNNTDYTGCNVNEIILLTGFEIRCLFGNFNLASRCQGVILRHQSFIVTSPSLHANIFFTKDNKVTNVHEH